MESIVSIFCALFLSLFLLLFPWVAVRLTKTVKWIGVLGPVSVCYIAGIILGNFFPKGWFPKEIPLTFADATIPLAIPLLLSSTDFRKCLGEARVALFSFFLSAVSVAIVSGIAGYFYASLHPETKKIAGMLSGMYTGGTPNLNAIGMALGSAKDTIALVNTVDIVIGGLYLLFLLTFGKKVFSLFLASEEDKTKQNSEVPEEQITFEKHNTFLFWKNLILSNGIGLLLAILGFGVSIAFTFLIFSSLYAPSILLGITTWGIGISFYSKVRELKTYEFGRYLILVFSVAIGFLANLEELKRDFGAVLIIVVSILTGSVLLHLLLGILFRIPIDTWIITSVSSIYGPAFVPTVAQAIGNRGILVVGILTGLIGYAIGNYLGIGIYTLLQTIDV
ncbi:DUF819 family protein [Leptospira gomenensis]|uniref:DUF819 family protein n=1 Tax=Leptospira gomenensis TaxID=2484974 RepID=A0A5F1Y9G7_9LEPT|nr:DUF819 family protein [Leptospira gomenensis]TGK32754.1 DUF819 family protein [Leptospira gomenensis]TGK36902.1 DUF819 family protein [Leptospira gomenensis]TGK44373.1 DUF819 family protein [Leptospira gomenensis]TGK58866.1 DUF819 family protein [Leptospira gomenensis]